MAEVKIVTGDNAIVAAKICREVGLNAELLPGGLTREALVPSEV
jgi:magnesium-transporting ATPase (P-type)